MPVEAASTPALELWAGVECTINRVGDKYFDQFETSGHATRLSDLDLFANLGISRLRYPVLWERTVPDGQLAHADWSWADERLARLSELSIRPIIGLLHHGSGPPHTSLIDPRFAEELADYARAVATRYPWIEAYTPVNEPLTTARFSGLYGHWYPHGRDDQTFVRALLAQCRAITFAMRAIREINPTAQLVQTEDLGKTFSTRALAYQAAFENNRRWLTFDLLTGRVNQAHPLWNYLREYGQVSERNLMWFVENPCPPDILGINHYLTSERFLDERLTRYPACTQGGNAFTRYADVEAVRVCTEGPAGPRALMHEAWERYELPLAVTEVHVGCTREEQLRWLKEVWDAAQYLRRYNDVDMRAVTVWSLLGAYDWNSLLKCAAGHYESGVFDLRAPTPRPTALARMMRDLAAGREYQHPVLETPGWWRRFERLIYPPVRRASGATTIMAPRGINMSGKRTRELLITGATGTLGNAFARLCKLRGLSYQLLTRQEMDIADHTSVEKALTELEPWAVINTAGYVRVDDAEHEIERCWRENTTGASVLAEACAQREIPLLTFSSDLVFDGTKQTPYVETDRTAPLNVYGVSKAEAETLVLDAYPQALIVRTSAFFGPWDEHNFVFHALRSLTADGQFIATDDAVISPTYVPDLVTACLDLLIDGERGIWHLVNQAQEVTWAELAGRAARLAGLDESAIKNCSTASLRLAAPRPLYSALASARGQLLPPLDDALIRYFEQCEVEWKSGVRHAKQAHAKTFAVAASGQMK